MLLFTHTPLPPKKQLTGEVDDLKRKLQSLEAANAALSAAAATAPNEQQESEAAAAAAAEAEQARLALQAAQEQQTQLQALLKEAVDQLEQERSARVQDSTQLERWVLLVDSSSPAPPALERNCLARVALAWRRSVCPCLCLSTHGCLAVCCCPLDCRPALLPPPLNKPSQRGASPARQGGGAAGVHARQRGGVDGPAAAAE